MTPECLRSRFVSRDDITTYRLRNTENTLALTQPRTNYLKKSLSYSGAGLWNSLSQNLRSAVSLNDLRLNCDTTVLNDYTASLKNSLVRIKLVVISVKCLLLASFK